MPSLEHNGKVLGESLDLIKYIDANFDGTPLFPNVSNNCALILFFAIITSSLISFSSVKNAFITGDNPHITNRF